MEIRCSVSLSAKGNIVPCTPIHVCNFSCVIKLFCSDFHLSFCICCKENTDWTGRIPLFADLLDDYNIFASFFCCLVCQFFESCWLLPTSWEFQMMHREWHFSNEYKTICTICLGDTVSLGNR